MTKWRTVKCSILYAFIARRDTESHIGALFGTKKFQRLLTGDGKYYREFYEYSDTILAAYETILAAKSVTFFTHLNVELNVCFVIKLSQCMHLYRIVDSDIYIIGSS